MRIQLLVQFFAVALLACPVAGRGAVRVSVDRDASIGVSRLELGVTHTHQSTDMAGARAAAVQRANAIMEQSARWQNTHIIGWGPGDINPEPGVYKWGTLDNRINMMRQLDIPMVITLCTAPGWMKVGGDTWNMEERIHKDYYDEFAELALKVAQRYPDVKHFQVWNEFKGFWSNADQNWDMVEYTKMYNAVYDKLKAWNPELQVGGLYLVISGTGSNLTRETGGVGRDFFEPIGNKDRQVIQYWLDNKHGADFIAIDRGIKDGQDLTPYTVDELMQFTRAHGQIVSQVRQMTDLPVWYSEYYGVVSDQALPTAAAYASIYRNMLNAGTSVALLWNPNDVATDRFPGLFTDVRNADGGVQTMHGLIYQWISEYFAPGTALFAVETDSLWVEGLASDAHLMLINKSDVLQELVLDNTAMSLLPYEVRLLDLQGRIVGSTLGVVPEPAGGLLMLGAAAWLGLRRRNTGGRQTDKSHTDSDRARVGAGTHRQVFSNGR